MGFYIQLPENQDKARQLLDLHNAKLEVGPFPPTKDKIPICVVSNGLFDAVGIGFSKDEVKVFSYPDNRPRVWMSLPREKVVELCPSVESMLPK